MASKYANPDISVSGAGYHLAASDPACIAISMAKGCGSHGISRSWVSVCEPQSLVVRLGRVIKFKPTSSSFVVLNGFSSAEKRVF